jgi:hypothetical protein
MEGKNPVHMAAWQGSLENLQHLIEVMGCDVNVISTAEYSYGKTPIFFALTRSRQEQVEYLLDRGALVRIVNNKGQSVLSIASSHMPEHTVRRIQELERKQPDAWRNYRETHSDGLEYGDLDGRFLDRPLRDSDDVTELAVNPTTARIRRGNFLRNNPSRAREARKKPGQPKRKKTSPPNLTQEEERELNEAWKRLECGLPSGDPQQKNLLTIVKMSDKRRREWIPEAADRIRKTFTSGGVIGDFLLSADVSDREASLLQKLASKVLEDSTAFDLSKCATTVLHRMNGQSLPRPPNRGPSLSDEVWSEACRLVGNLSISRLENGDPILSLNRPPTWVDSFDQLANLQRAVASQQLVAIDTEWLDSKRVSTLQVALEDKAWVLDLVGPDAAYLSNCRNFIKSLFHQKTLLGFAMGHDIPKLERFVGEELPTNACVDLQLLWSGKELPGLAACAREFSAVPLCKKQQCSDWGQRPLSQAQLDYAGLDAAVLPFLLAEKKKSSS